MYNNIIIMVDYIAVIINIIGYTINWLYHIKNKKISAAFSMI